ncbi:phBC6A51 family helix-turn-helix protein [Sporosarcina sp. 179-K 8C2 HS]|uniref:phBC6A51 family helix-turn-helix protein n=1 Tax=Sporosarcina sp. 179-K 8C2 HS TaxID=3142387 RepID=UPI00399FA1F8
MDIYAGLNENEIRAVKELANKAGRTYEEVAKAVGISERQLYRIRQKPQVKAAVRELVIQDVEDDLPDIMRSLRSKAKRGDFRSQELVVKMTGLLVERSEVKQTIEDNRFKGMSEEDIDKELANIEQQLKVIEGGAN